MAISATHDQLSVPSPAPPAAATAVMPPHVSWKALAPIAVTLVLALLPAPEGLAPIPGGSVSTTPGFHAAGIACGLKPSSVLDLGVLFALGPVASAFVDTTSALPAAPVIRNRTLDRLRAAGRRPALVALGSPSDEDGGGSNAVCAPSVGGANGSCSSGRAGGRSRAE